MDTNKLSWPSILLSAVLIFVTPIIVSYTLSLGFGLVVGFQTRGDSTAIEQSLRGFGSSGLVIATQVVALGLVAFVRARLLAAKVPDAALMNAMVAVGLGLVLRVFAGIFIWPASDMNAFMVRTAIEIVGALAAGYAGVYMVTKDDVPERGTA
jgi:hypothetical protein